MPSCSFFSFSSSSLHLLHVIYLFISLFLLGFFGVLFLSFSSLITFLFFGVSGWIILSLLKGWSSLVPSPSPCSSSPSPCICSPSPATLLFFLGGWQGSILLSVLTLSFALAFFLILIFSSRVSSFSRSSLSSALHFSKSFSPSLVVSLGKAHLLYSDFEFMILLVLLAFCISTDSMIWRSKAVCVVFSTLIPNFILSQSSSSSSCTSRRCRSIWELVLQAPMSF